MPNHPRAALSARLLCAISFCALLALCIQTTTVYAEHTHPYLARQPFTSQFAPTTDSSYPASVIASINQNRANAGLHALSSHPLLVQAAQIHANDMLAHNHYSHVGTDGSRVNARVRRTGYPLDGWSSENWVSVRNPGQAVQWWMNSRVHRGNILNPRWTDIGIGMVVHPTNGQTIFVAVFARPSGTVPTPVIQSASVPQSPQSSPAKPVAIPNEYTVRSGDTLSSIAARYGLAWEDVAALNGLQEQSVLQIGQIVRLLNDTVAATATRADDDPNAGAAGQVLREQLPSHTVQAGDTLFTIAGRYSVRWQQVAAANALVDTDILQIGQVLVIPNAEGDKPQQSSNRAVTSATPMHHTVQSGETIIHIAARYKLDWQALLQRNGLAESTVLRVGQRIQLR